MNNIKSISFILALFLLGSCGVSKMVYHLPLSESSEKVIYDVSNFSNTFGQMDTKVQTDTPYHLYLESGFYYANHLSLSVTAREGKRENTMCVAIRASHGRKFVKNFSRKPRKMFLNELKNALIPPVE